LFYGNPLFIDCMSECRREEIAFEFALESVNGFGSLAIFILSEFFKGLFSAVCFLVPHSFGVCILDSKAGHVSMDYVEL